MLERESVDQPRDTIRQIQHAPPPQSTRESNSLDYSNIKEKRKTKEKHSSVIDIFIKINEKRRESTG